MKWLYRMCAVAVLLNGGGCGESGPGAQAAAERVAAEVAVDFAHALRVNDLERVCSLARKRAAKTLRCANRPRIPPYLRIPRHHRINVLEVGSTAEETVRVGIPVEDMPVLGVEVDDTDKVVNVSGYGHV